MDYSNHRRVIKGEVQTKFKKSNNNTYSIKGNYSYN